MKISKLLFCRVAVLIPLTVLQAWQNMHLVIDISKITTLLAVLRIALIIEVLLSLIREAVYLNYDEVISCGEGYHFITTAIMGPCYYTLTVGIRMTIMGLLLLLAAKMNIYVLLLLAGLIPLEIHTYILLHRELRNRSWSVLEQHSGWQELLAADQRELYSIQAAEQPAQYRSTPYKHTQTSRRVTQLLRLSVKITVVALAAYELATEFNPILLSYGVILPLFFILLREFVYRNISKQDIINSTKYVDEIEDKLNGDTSNRID